MSSRPGRNRQLVLNALKRARRPMKAYELLELLREYGLRAPLQIYRALDGLIEEGAVHKIESLSAFAICSHDGCGGDGHTLFAICTKCGLADEFQDPALERALRRIARKQGFNANAATVELSGLCETCASAQ